MLPGAVIGVSAAWVLAAYVSDAYVRLAVGVIAFGFVLNYAFTRLFARHHVESSRPIVRRGVFWGSVSGFTSTLCQAGGPPFQVYVLPQRLDKLTFVGTMAIFFAIINVMKVIPYFALGQFSTAGITTSIMLIPLAVATNFLGIWLVRITPTTMFYKLTYVLMFGVSIALIHRSMMDLLGR